MVILITGASHTGKTVLAQRLLEKLGYPYLSVDHLKMGLIRSGYTDLTPEDDDELTGYLWPVVREMVKTAIENRQNMIVEGCYVPFDWRKDFTEEYLADIRFVCLAMTEAYVDAHFAEIRKHASDVECRIEEDDFPAEWIKEINRQMLDGFTKAGEKVVVIDSDYKAAIKEAEAAVSDDDKGVTA